MHVLPWCPQGERDWRRSRSFLFTDTLSCSGTKLQRLLCLKLVGALAQYPESWMMCQCSQKGAGRAALARWELGVGLAACGAPRAELPAEVSQEGCSDAVVSVRMNILRNGWPGRISLALTWGFLVLRLFPVWWNFSELIVGGNLAVSVACAAFQLHLLLSVGIGVWTYPLLIPNLLLHSTIYPFSLGNKKTKLRSLGSKF